MTSELLHIVYTYSKYADPNFRCQVRMKAPRQDARDKKNIRIVVSFGWCIMGKMRIGERK